MSDKLKKALIGAVVAIGLALAVSYGLISQQTADKLQSDANQALSQDQVPPPAPQQPQPAPQNPGAQPSAPAQPNPAPYAAPAPRQ